ncbi:NAC domain-containing protein [Drosera capensis]
MGRDGSPTSLAPGFRFHPTDEELVSYYLRRKVTGKPFRFDAIADIDIYKTEPWILPGHSKLKTRDLEWYFFSNLDKKYGNGSRTNRATEEGYWKTTGKDRKVYHRGRVVGMKKTLVYHRGRAPRGERTNWVMHEYRSIDGELEKAGIPQETLVLCRIFQKSGSGPKNGERYGAPLLDEEWEDDDIVTMVPGNSGSDEVIADNWLGERGGSNQGLDDAFLADLAPIFTLNQEHGGTYVEDFGQITGDEEKPLTGMSQNPLGQEYLDDQNFSDVPLQLQGDVNVIKYEYALQEGSEAVNPAPANSWINEPVHVAGTEASFGHDQTGRDTAFNASTGDGLFLEANDLSEPVHSNPSDFELLEEYLTFFDAEDDIGKYLSFDSPERFDAEVSLPDQAYVSQKTDLAKTEQVPSYGKQVPGASDSASSSKSGVQNPLSKQVNSWLGSIPAPPAFAGELSTKAAMAAKLNAATQCPGPVHVTAGMVRVRNTAPGGKAVHWSLDKIGNVNVVVSFNLPESADVTSPANIASAVSRGWSCFFFFWFMM